MMMHEYRSALDELAAFNAGEGEDEDGKAIFGRLVAAVRKIIAARARDWHGVLDKVTVAQNVARAFQDNLSLRVNVRTVDKLPRFEMKAHRWVRQ